MNYNQIWEGVLGEIEINLSKINFNTWFKDTFLDSINQDKAVIGVPSVFVKKWLEDKYHKIILDSLIKKSGINISEIIYKVELKKNKKNNNIDFLNIKKEESLEKKDNNKNNNNSLNPKYTFETFVVGKNNNLAYAACQAVVDDLNSNNKQYNPLFIYGGVGLGKTHLLQAIGNEALKITNKVLYITSEKFINDYVQSVRAGKGKEFKNIYRNVDVLLVDDVQFMGGKEGTQEEFFHTFNELKQADKQIILSSDKPPKAIPAIEERLISRFQSGMLADIGKPDIETKTAILVNKIKEKSYNLDEEIVLYIANNIQNNIRELEGALNKIIVYHQMSNENPSLDSVKRVLGDYISNIQSKQLSGKDIISAVSKFYNISFKDIIGNSRKKELVWPRQVAIFLIREELDSSYPNIGEIMGGRDHTTAMHAYNKIKKEINENNNERIKQEIESIKQLFNSV